MKILGGLSTLDIGEIELNIVSGLIYSKERLFRGYVQFDTERILEVQEGEPPQDSISKGLIIPLLANCHTHIGDACLRGKIGNELSLEEIVRPPKGLKHQLLSQCKDEEISNGMRSAMDEMRRFGVGSFIDFREGGIRGLSQLKSAMTDRPLSSSIILTRPKELTYSEQEVETLLAESDGIGASAMRDWKFDDLLCLAEHAYRKKKIFALHASEGRREELEDILDLRPDFLIHMSNASADDLQICVEEDIPIVVCPRSNARFGLKTDIARMIDLGVNVCLGTDNAMLNSLSVLDEMRAAYLSRFNSRPLTPAEILRLAVDNSRKVLKDKTIIGIEPGAPCEFMVVRAGSDDSPERILSDEFSYSIDLLCSNNKIWWSPLERC